MQFTQKLLCLVCLACTKPVHADKRTKYSKMAVGFDAQPSPHFAVAGNTCTVSEDADALLR